jgi:uncharacterized membrane protein YedE/YeeE
MSALASPQSAQCRPLSKGTSSRSSQPDSATRHQGSHDGAPVSAAAAAVQHLRDWLVPVLCGLLFGAAFQLSRVHEVRHARSLDIEGAEIPSRSTVRFILLTDCVSCFVSVLQCYFIREQLLLHRFLMLKMFLSAAATSMLVFALLPLVSRTAADRIVQRRDSSMTIKVAELRGVPALLLGGGLLGVGMAVSGSCPGTVFAQIGAGSHAARFVLAGGLLAGFIYPLLELSPSFSSILKQGRANFQSQTLTDLLGVGKKESWRVSLAAVVGIACIVGALEYFFPWRSELDALPMVTSGPAGSATISALWFTLGLPARVAPWVAGVMVGSLQIPLLLLADKQLGSSSSYVTVVANLVHAVSARSCEKVPSFKSKRDVWWQVCLMMGVCMGASLTSSATFNPVRSDGLVSPYHGLLGGFLLVSGSRIASGCTSGHGISGMGYLAINSVLAVAAMFGAGIITAQIVFK